MTPQQRQLWIGIGSLLCAGMVHSNLPSGDIWVHAAITGATATAIAGLLMLFLPKTGGP